MYREQTAHFFSQKSLLFSIQTFSMKSLYVYILKCSDQTYYTGVTNNIERRFIEHNSGIAEFSYTAQRLPVELVYFTLIEGPLQAIAKEKQIKKWSQSKKEALINGEFDRLPNLAKKRFG